MSYTDLYMSGIFLKRVNNDSYYHIISDPSFFAENKLISTQTVINANSKDIYFDELTVNNELTIYGELEIMSST